MEWIEVPTGVHYDKLPEKQPGKIRICLNYDGSPAFGNYPRFYIDLNKSIPKRTCGRCSHLNMTGECLVLRDEKSPPWAKNFTPNIIGREEVYAIDCPFYTIK